jgi:hypothetical protein
MVARLTLEIVRHKTMISDGRRQVDFICGEKMLLIVIDIGSIKARVHLTFETPYDVWKIFGNEVPIDTINFHSIAFI